MLRALNYRVLATKLDIVYYYTQDNQVLLNYCFTSDQNLTCRWQQYSFSSCLERSYLQRSFFVVPRTLLVLAQFFVVLRTLLSLAQFFVVPRTLLVVQFFIMPRTLLVAQFFVMPRTLLLLAQFFVVPRTLLVLVFIKAVYQRIVGDFVRLVFQT